jgi:predicted transglutaminase-like cysteine proteinase
MKQLFSDQLWNKYKDTIITYIEAETSLQKSKVVFYPFRPKMFQDIKNVFKQTEKDDAELLSFYQKYWDSGRNRTESVRNVAQAVNNRLSYISDISNPNFKTAEYWASPIEIHRNKKDDCDGFSVLITYVLRLLGLREFEVFTAVGYVTHPNGKREYHAYTLVLRRFNKYLWFYPIEGSFYPNESLRNWEKGISPLKANPRYEIPEWITNDKLSYSNSKWFRLKLIK